MTPNLGMLAALAGWWIVVAAEGPSLTPEAMLAQAGFAGLFAISLWRRWLYIGSWVQEKDARIAQLEDENARLRSAIQEGQLKLIADLTAALDRATAKATRSHG